MKFERFNHSILDFNSKTHSGSQIPCPVLMHTEDGAEFIRIFFSARDSQNRSNIFYSDHDSTDLRLLYVHDESVMDLGLPGTFNADGCIASQVILSKDYNLEILLFVGVTKGGERSPYRYEQGVATRPLGSNEKFVFSHNILTRRNSHPIGASMPYYTHYFGPGLSGDKPLFQEYLFYINFLFWRTELGENNIKRWEPTYKIQLMDVKFRELIEPSNFDKYKRRADLPFNKEVHGVDGNMYEAPESLGRPWVFQDGNRLCMVYCERQSSLYRGECLDRGYKIKMSCSSYSSPGNFGFETNCLTDCYIPYHSEDKMQAYPAIIENSAGDRFLLFNSDFQSPIQAARWIKAEK